MSYLQCNFFSKALGSYVDVTVCVPSVQNGMASMLPYEEVYAPRGKFKTLYLLHGALDDHSSWTRKTCVEDMAEAKQLALVMPSGQNGFYVNAVHGLAYYTFINYELPLWAESLFPLSTKREDRYIAGLSMGGYGALRHALSSPERYAAAGAFSGVVDIDAMKAAMAGAGMSLFDYDSIFGPTIKGTDNDLFALAEKCSRSGQPLPKLFIGCGTDDALCYKMDARFTKHVRALGYDTAYEELPGGHEWPVWNHLVKTFLDMPA